MLQSFFLQIDVAEIVLHEADQPNTFFDLLDTDSLPGEEGAEIDFFAVETDTSALGDVDGLVVERIIKFGQAAIGTAGRSRSNPDTWVTECLTAKHEQLSEDRTLPWSVAGRAELRTGDWLVLSAVSC